MTFQELLARTFFGLEAPPEVMELGLSYRGEELTVSGYVRALLPRGDWVVIEGDATRKVTFGPFGRAAAFDAAFLVVAGDERSVLSLDGDVRVLAGMVVEVEVAVVVILDG